MGEIRSAYKILVRKPEGRCTWENNTKLDLRGTEWERGLDSTGSGQWPVACSCEHGNEPSSSI